MKILSNVYFELINNCSLITESGGIIGITYDTITHYQFDKPDDISEYCYYPNVENLNTIIREWQKENIEFAGIFHSHPTGVTSLSHNDEEYIRDIMNAIQIFPLYFPVIAPMKSVQLYKAEIDNNGICICNDPITILDSI